MAYKLYDINGNTIAQHDLQDKGEWCRKGASKEEVFIEKVGGQLGLAINPAKALDPYAPDLLVLADRSLADLKTQNTPFFQARDRYGYDPQYTVVFNGKDRLRYSENYPYIGIYFGVDWQAIKFVGIKTITVSPMTGIWYIAFPELHDLLDSAPFHRYYRRVDDDKGNAKGSYLLDIRNPLFTKVK